MILTLLAAHDFRFDRQRFLLDGQEVFLRAGEVHPSRIPHQYWEHRIRMVKAMGLNTISIYVFWNAHEMEDGSFDFSTPQNDIPTFVRLCQDNGMHVLVRPGPYVCGEWDLGGLPAYTLRDPNAKIRQSSDAAFVAAYRRYLAALADALRDLMICNGGPIAMIQVENEYGFWYTHDQEYLRDIRQVWLDHGVAGPFFNADPPSVTSKDIRLEGMAIGLNGGGVGQSDFDMAFRLDPDVPSFVTEVYPGWFRHWGDGSDWAPTDISGNIESYLAANKSFIFYVAHGGTSFGLTSGSNWINGLFTQDLTSYDYGSPISEAGDVSFNYMRYRDIMARSTEGPLADIPAPIAKMQVPNIRFERVAGVFDQPFAAEQPTDQPMHFEHYGQNQGLGVYEATLPTGAAGKLNFTHLNDYAAIYLNGRFVANFTRTKSNKFVFDLPAVEAPGKLEVLVEAMGHINWDNQVETDRKGVFGPVLFNGQEIKGWTLRRLPLEHFTDALVERDEQSYRHGGVFKAVIDLQETADTYIDFTGYFKGYIYVNGHNLGRYWGIGPQYRLFCPGVWLNRGKNTIYFLELESQQPATATAFELVKGCPEGQKLAEGYCQ